MMYRVIWEVDIDAEDPVSAARAARKMQLDAESTATIFEVFSATPKQRFDVDLMTEDKKEQEDAG